MPCLLAQLICAIEFPSILSVSCLFRCTFLLLGADRRIRHLCLDLVSDYFALCLARPIPIRTRSYQFSDKLFCFDLDTYTRTVIESVGQPSARYKHACARFGRFMLVFGGADDLSHKLNDLFLFDLGSFSFSISPMLASEHYSHNYPIPDIKLVAFFRFRIA